MKNKGIAKNIVFFLSGLSLVSLAYSTPQNMSERGSFFDAEPPSYLSPQVNSGISASQVDSVENLDGYYEVSVDAIAVEDSPPAKIAEKPLVTNRLNSKGSQSVSLPEAAQLIVLYHPRVAQALGNEKSELEMINVAKSAYYPEVRGGLGMRYDRNTTSREDREYTPSADIEINQTLYDFGRTESSVKSAEYGHLGAKAYTSATNEELIHAATSDVVAIVRDQALINLAEQQVFQVQSLGVLVEERYGKGASNLSDVLQVQSRIDDVESVALDAEARYESTLRNLGIMIGRPNLSSVEIGRLPENLGQACSTLLQWEDIPEYAIADLEAKRAQAELDFSKSNEMPTISLQGSVSHPFNDSSRRGYRNDTRISLNVSVPFYEGGRLEANKRAASNRMQSAEARKDEVRLQVNQALSQLQVQLQNMQKRQSLLSRRVENLKGTKELYKRQYLDLGTRSLIDLLNSEQEYHQAQVDVAVNQSSIIQAQLDCAYYQGKLREYFNISDR